MTIRHADKGCTPPTQPTRPAAIELGIALDHNTPEPMSRQIVRQIAEGVARGTLRHRSAHYLAGKQRWRTRSGDDQG